MNIRDRLIEMLEQSGHTRVANPRTTKYIVYKAGENENFYLGKSGALRMGRTTTSSNPVPLLRANLLRRWAKQQEPTT